MNLLTHQQKRHSCYGDCLLFKYSNYGEKKALLLELNHIKFDCIITHSPLVPNPGPAPCFAFRSDHISTPTAADKIILLFFEGHSCFEQK